jgi:hypothetical protein
VKHQGFILISPLISLGLLGAILTEQRTHIKPEDVEPYHARAREAVDNLPWHLSVPGAFWVGQDVPVQEAAITLLRPNVILNRRYIDTVDRRRSASLLIVQCRDSRDMLGHYPPVCYPAHGQTLENQATIRQFMVDGMEVPATEYMFVTTVNEHPVRTTVFNFLIVPGQGIVPDMNGVRRAAGDYQQRYFGAAQLQVLVSGEIPAEERDRVFTEIVTATAPVIRTLKSGGMQ